MAVFFFVAEEEQAAILYKILRFRIAGGMDEERKSVEPAKVTRNNQPDVLQMSEVGFESTQRFHDFNYWYWGCYYV